MSTQTRTLFKKPSTFFNTFERRPGPLKKSMHYCPGCGHGNLHKLVAEAIDELGIGEKTIFVCPVGCSVFAYYYFNLGSISVPHGRAPAVATGMTRGNPDCYTVTYQGDGDLGAIGLNDFLQAANRGENICALFVNNAVYGMTGGQMAPTSLPGQKTTTSPYGRNIENDGLPLRVSEMVSVLDTPIYVERVALNSIKHIRAARKALNKGLRYMKERKGFSLIEFLTSCPTNLKLSPVEADKWVEENMIPYFPLKCFKDIADQRQPINRPQRILDKEKVRELLFTGLETPAPALTVPALPPGGLQIKCAGFGGQGILSLGLMIATAAHKTGLQVTWLPSYGPEVRGGTANCSVVINDKPVGSPFVDHPQILLILNQPSMEKFAPELVKDGLLIYDSSTIEPPPPTSVPHKLSPHAASEIANGLGTPRCANSVLLGALSNAIPFIPTEAFKATIRESFAGKKNVAEINLKAFDAGKGSACS